MTSRRLRRGRQRWRNTALRGLRVFQRLLPAEKQRVFALTLLLGGLCGLAAVAFHLAIQAAEEHLIDRALAAPGWLWIAWTLVLPTVGGLISGAILTFVVPDARGSGIPQVKVAYAVKGGRMSFRVVLGKFGLGVLQIGTGASLGREGPTVQICAGIASVLGRAAALSRQNLQRLLPVGAAAGIAAAFNAPIAAVTFTIEEVIGDLNQAVLAGIIVAAALAAAIEHQILGAHPVFAIPTGYGLHHTISLVLYALLGLAAAGVAIAFCDGLLVLRARFGRMRLIPAWARPGIGGLVTGGLAVVALLWLGTGGVTGAGYATLSRALAGALPVKVLLALCGFKCLATMFSYSSGGAGGLFAPSLFIGGMLGGAIGFVDVQIFHHAPSEIGAFALVGMGAVFAGIIRAPITSILIILEMTGGYDLILPLMIANMTAYTLARAVRPLPIYEALLAQDGVHLPHGPRPARHVLDHLRVIDALQPEVTAFPARMTVAAALAASETVPFSSFPVVDAEDHLVGMVTEARLRRTVADGGGDRPVGEIVDERPPVIADQSLLAALAAMDQADARQLAVVDNAVPAHLVGMLTMSDIIHAQATALRRSGHPLSGDSSMSEVAETIQQPTFKRLPALGEPAPAPGTSLRYHVVAVEPDSAVVGRPISALGFAPGVLIVTIDRGGQPIVPQGTTVITAGDLLTIFADQEQLARTRDRLAAAAPPYGPGS